MSVLGFASVAGLLCRVVFPCSPESTSMPGKPLAGPGFRGDEQLSGNLTSSMHTSCLGWTWADRGGSKPWPEKGDFFSCAGTALSLWSLPVLGNIFLYPPREESCLHFLRPYEGSRAAWSSTAEPGPSQQGQPWLVMLTPGKPHLQLLPGRTCPVDNRSSPLSLHAEKYHSLSLTIFYMLCIHAILQGKVYYFNLLSSNIHNHDHKSITEVEPHSLEQSELQGRVQIRLKQIFL